MVITTNVAYVPRTARFLKSVFHVLKGRGWPASSSRQNRKAYYDRLLSVENVLSVIETMRAEGTPCKSDFSVLNMPLNEEVDSRTVLRHFGKPFRTGMHGVNGQRYRIWIYRSKIQRSNLKIQYCFADKHLFFVRLHIRTDKDTADILNQLLYEKYNLQIHHSGSIAVYEDLNGNRIVAEGPSYHKVLTYIFRAAQMEQMLDESKQALNKEGKTRRKFAEERWFNLL